MPTSNRIEWQIENIRVTAFLRNQLNPNKLESWLNKVSENEPSRIGKSPKSFIGISRTMAGFLKVNWSANRLNIILSSEEPQVNQSIGPISDINPLFAQFVDHVPEVEELGPVDRIAIGLVLFFQVPNESDGLSVLSKSITSVNIDRSVRDFLLRINHLYTSRVVDKLLINRLATWSVGQMQIIQIQVNEDGSQDQKTISESSIAIRLELDINTAKDVQLEADSTKLKLLLQELKTIAFGIAEGGEVSMVEQG